MNTTFNKQDMISFGNYGSEQARINGRTEIFEGDLENWKLLNNPNFDNLSRLLGYERKKLADAEMLKAGPLGAANREYCEKIIQESGYAIKLLEKALLKFE